MIVNPKGIDLPIQEMQQLFEAGLWADIDASRKQFNHRVFRNIKDGELIPEIYTDTNEYQEVLFDDYLSALCWFDVSDTTDSYELGQINQNVGVFFAVNLSDLYPTLSHRAVEEAHLSVQKIILKRAAEWEITGISTGLAAYGDFATDSLKFQNMQPWHTFRFDCNLRFFLNNCK